VLRFGEAAHGSGEWAHDVELNAAEEFSASKDGCNLRIGPYRFTGNLREYTITGAAEDVSAEVRLEGTTESWRPETGHVVFGAGGETIFAWTAFVPFGKVTATYRIGSEVHETTGTGYHDHNWINREMGHLIDRWWWAKGQVGPYAFISAHIVAAKKYGYVPFHFFMLARDGVVIADDGAKVTSTHSGSQIDEHTGKPVPDALCLDYRDGDRRYVMTYSRQHKFVSREFLRARTGATYFRTVRCTWVTRSYSTITRSVALRPNVSGAYISSALAGGATYCPGVVARVT
jgi:hypothetical protein